MNYVSRLFGYGGREHSHSSPNLSSSSSSSSSSEEEPPSSYESLKAKNSDKDESITTENEANKKSLWPFIKGLIGVDITQTVSLPIWIFEDTTYLQRLCEMAEFDHFLDKAAECENPYERLLYIALFCVTGYHGTERYDKPFNPVIGETYEYVRPDGNGQRYIAEQVSHKPPISVCHFESKNYRCWQQGCLNVRFLGNSLDLDSTGSKGYITFPRTGETFAWTTPRATVHNCLVGKVWVDHHGTMPIRNCTTGDRIDLKWKKCGWFGGNRYEVEGDVVDSKGKSKIEFFGKWNGTLSAKWLFDGEHPKGTTVSLWVNDTTQIGIHKQTPYCFKMNEINDEYERQLPPTDSRLRPDRRFLQKEENDKASAYKILVEERQRTQENARRAKGDPWAARWFRQVPDEWIDGTTFVYTGGYWEEREQKHAILTEEPERAEKLLVREGYEGLACDFRSYQAL